MFNQEQGFILQCLRKLVSPSQINLNLDKEFAQQLDWDEIIKTCQGGRVLGFIAFVLDKENLLPLLQDRVQALLMAVMLQYQRDNRIKKEQFEKINSILNQNSIPVIPLKGIALSYLIYKKIPFRTMGDVDILIRPDDLHNTTQLLRQAGFDDRYSRSINRWHDQIREIVSGTSQRPDYLGRKTFVGEEFDIDVHYSPRYFIAQQYVEMNDDAVWQRASLNSQWASNIYMLSPQDQIWHLIVHMSGSIPPALVQMLDIVLMMKTCNITGRDIMAHASMELDLSVRSEIETKLAILEEIFSANFGGQDISQDISQQAVKILEPFFSGGFHPVGFLRSLKNIPSYRLRLLYIAGYFLPNPAYYSFCEDGKVIGYFRYLGHRHERLRRVLGHFVTQQKLGFKRGLGISRHYDNR